MSTARLTQRAAYTPVCWAQLLPRCWMALYSLFGPGNSIVKWLLLETSTRKLWMAAAAPVMVYDDGDTWWMLRLWSLLMQSLFYRQTWFICHWPFLLIERSESLSFRVHCDNPRLVFCFFFLFLCSIDCRLNKKAVTADLRQWSFCCTFVFPEQTCKD